jgi:excisionase family DNA binding protein
MTKLFYSDIQVAEILCVSRGTIWKLVREKRLAQPCRLKGRLSRWHIDDINAFIRQVRGE